MFKTIEEAEGYCKWLSDKHTASLHEISHLKAEIKNKNHQLKVIENKLKKKQEQVVEIDKEVRQSAQVTLLRNRIKALNKKIKHQSKTIGDLAYQLYQLKNKEQ